MKHFNSDTSFNKPEDKSKKKDRTSWLSIWPFISLLCCFGPAMFEPGPMKKWVGPPAPLPCAQIEIDAQNTRKSLYNYFKEYERDDLPPFEGLAEIYSIKVAPNSSVVITGTRDEPIITVFDTHDLCPKGPSYVVNMTEYVWYWQRY